MQYSDAPTLPPWTVHVNPILHPRPKVEAKVEAKVETQAQAETTTTSKAKANVSKTAANPSRPAYGARVAALLSGEMFSGKDTCASILHAVAGYERFALADPIRHMAVELWADLSVMFGLFTESPLTYADCEAQASKKVPRRALASRVTTRTWQSPWCWGCQSEGRSPYVFAADDCPHGIYPTPVVGPVIVPDIDIVIDPASASAPASASESAPTSASSSCATTASAGESIERVELRRCVLVGETLKLKGWPLTRGLLLAWLGELLLRHTLQAFPDDRLAAAAEALFDAWARMMARHGETVTTLPNSSSALCIFGVDNRYSTTDIFTPCGSSYKPPASPASVSASAQASVPAYAFVESVSTPDLSASDAAGVGDAVEDAPMTPGGFEAPAEAYAMAAAAANANTCFWRQGKLYTLTPSATLAAIDALVTGTPKVPCQFTVSSEDVALFSSAAGAAAQGAVEGAGACASWIVPTFVGQPMTPRWIMQWLGTDLCRTHLRDDLWIVACVSRISHSLARHVAVTDVRFPNESAVLPVALADKGFTPYRVRVKDPHAKPKDATEAATSHASETAIASLQVDAEIWNDKTRGIDALEAELRAVFAAAALPLVDLGN